MGQYLPSLLVLLILVTVVILDNRYYNHVRSAQGVDERLLVTLILCGIVAFMSITLFSLIGKARSVCFAILGLADMSVIVFSSTTLILNTMAGFMLNAETVVALAISFEFTTISVA